MSAKAMGLGLGTLCTSPDVKLSEVPVDNILKPTTERILSLGLPPEYDNCLVAEDRHY